MTVDEILSRLEGVKRNGDGWMGRCLAHDDRNPSLHISEGVDGKVLLKCFAGCTNEAVCAALGITAADLFPSREQPAEPERTYVYTDEDGKPLHRTVRHARRAGAKKSFHQEHFEDGQWVKGLSKPWRRVVYHLPDVINADALGEEIWICEGEKDADRLAPLVAAATTNPMGAGKWSSDYNQWFRGSNVTIVADTDDAGRRHAEEVARELIPVAASVRILQPATGKDLSDHLADGKTLDDLEPFSVEEPLAAPAAAAQRSSWQRVNLAELPPREIVTPTIGSGGFVYPGKRHGFSGPPESLKTLAAYIIGLEEIRAGGTVLLLDFEMGPWDARDRLRDLGATDDELGRIPYFEPATEPTAATIEALLELEPALVIIDAAAGAYAASDLDDMKRKDAETWAKAWVQPFWAQNVATIVIDHVIKDAAGRGKYSIGSERKLGGVDVHLGFEVVHELTRGGHGLCKIVTHKDRPGFLPRPRAGELELTSDPVTHAITWEFKAATAPSADSSWRPTVLMERVLEYLATVDEPVNRTTVTKGVVGKKEYILQAIGFLILDGDVAEIGSKKLLQLEKRFPTLETDLERNGSPTVPDE